MVPAAEMTDAAKLEELKRMCGPETDAQLRKGGECLDADTLRRWLMARKGDAKEAAKDLKAHAVWRAEYVPKGRISEDEVRSEIAQNKTFLPGFDREGRPLCVVVVSRHDGNDAAQSKRFITYSLDTAVAMGAQTPGWDGKMSGIFDLRGLKASNCDFATLRNVFDLLQHHYPERLHKLWLYDAPMIFYGLWKLVCPFIDPVTREKVQFVYEKDAQKDFAAAFDMNVLPPELQPGGTGRWISVSERCRLLRADQEAQAEANGAMAEEAGGSAGVGKEQQPDAALRPVEVVA